MIDVLKPLIKQFLPFAQKQMGFDRPPRLFLKNDSNEANNPMGKTGYYDPQNESITIYIGKRHPKDIMRSLSHELMHHTQNCKGEFDSINSMGEQGYAQRDPHMRQMEIQAYQASIVFRDWEDSCKGTIYYEHLQKGENKMSTKDWKNKELTTLLSEAWGFKFNNLEEFNEFNGNGEVQEEEVEASAETVEEATEDTVAEVADEITTEDTSEEVVDEEIVAEDTEDALEEEEELEEGKGKYDDGDKHDERCDHVPCNEEQVKSTRPTKEQIETIVNKVIKEVLQNRKG